MNTVNASTDFSGFQLHFGRSPHIIPPMVPSNLPTDMADPAELAHAIIINLESDVAAACDNLLHAKIQQAHHASSSRSPEPNYSIGDFVMLSTFNR
ncbi:hypothetical protein PILCRDRAFT_79234 [Piloderma croceum F 1598]|uniref:Uncharacterized protein n=1 Tax=Piloderma croceum (strain F 1598) TaxID=765440 RepID=A0A0C3BDA0_PILCF|nr:hypothetical protein PILCRDRAFT_79234 [Piloderma croceum F 1598]